MPKKVYLKNLKINHALTFGMPKKFYKYWVSLCDIIRVKRSASCGQVKYSSSVHIWRSPWSRGQRPNFIMHTAPDCLFLFFAVALAPLFDGLIMTGVMDCYLTGGNWRQYSERSVHFQFILPQKDYIVVFGVYFDINGYLECCSWPLLSQLDPINCSSLAKISKDYN